MFFFWIHQHLNVLPYQPDPLSARVENNSSPCWACMWIFFVVVYRRPPLLLIPVDCELGWKAVSAQMERMMGGLLKWSESVSGQTGISSLFSFQLNIHGDSWSFHSVCLVFPCISGRLGDVPLMQMETALWQPYVPPSEQSSKQPTSPCLMWKSHPGCHIFQRDAWNSLYIRTSFTGTVSR